MFSDTYLNLKLRFTLGRDQQLLPRMRKQGGWTYFYAASREGSNPMLS